MIAHVEYKGCIFSNKSQHGTKKKCAFIEPSRKVQGLITRKVLKENFVFKIFFKKIKFYYENKFK